jgi:hypothetical protein
MELLGGRGWGRSRAVSRWWGVPMCWRASSPSSGMQGRGRRGALLISREAGAGKTALAHEACAQDETTVHVLWGSCLPPTS